MARVVTACRGRCGGNAHRFGSVAVDMCASHTSVCAVPGGIGRCRGLPGRVGCARVSPTPIQGRPPTTVDEIRAYVRNNDVEFLFAQFVDMHGKPNAKLVPAATSTTCSPTAPGFAGFAAGDIGQRPNDPDMHRHARRRAASRRCRGGPSVARLACDVDVEGEPWPYCPRTILRRQLERAPTLGFELKIGAELEYFLVRRREDGGDRGRRRARHPRAALLRHARADAQPRLRQRGRARHLALGWDNYATDHEDANGQFEQNFAFADALTTCDRADLLPLHGRGAGAGARADRDLHAQAVRAPDRQRLPLPHEPLARRESTCSTRPGRRPARHGPVAAPPTTSSAA